MEYIALPLEIRNNRVGVKPLTIIPGNFDKEYKHFCKYANRLYDHLKMLASNFGIEDFGFDEYLHIEPGKWSVINFRADDLDNPPKFIN
jgi:uncharacterized cupin superfamily protein